MKNVTIEELAYMLKQAKENNQPKPIFFLGAGASKSGNIPLAGDITKDILDTYSNAPAIKKLDVKEKSYSNLMECLQPYERDKLLKGYIDKAKINVTHIYLAQLIHNGFVDYILTVNFDNLMLRALSLFNIFPSTYDMAILKDLTTTTFKEKSVVFLHGQHHGLWLLNTVEEMKKVNATVPRIFDSIKNKRPWIFIGYSGDDPIFEHIKNLGRFDNGLYWITYNNNNPNERVKKFLETPNTNASIIKGYDSDSFMLKLNTVLELDQPMIINKPFTSVREMLNNIVDIDDDEHFKGIKERLEISKEQVDQAIKQFEKGEIASNQEIKRKSKIDLLKKEIINLLIKKAYNKDIINEISEKAKRANDNELNIMLAELHSDWGAYLADLAETKEGKEADELFREAFDKFQKTIDIKPDHHVAFYNWGTTLGNLAKTKEGKEVDELFREAFDKFQKTIDIKPDSHQAFNNWGSYLGDLAKTKEGKEADELFREAFDKFQKAIDLKPDKYAAFNNWGNSLVNLAKTKEGKEADELYKDAFDKFQKSIDIKPDSHEAFYNWGNSLGNLAATKEGKEADELFREAFDKFQKAIDIKPDSHEAFYNWGNSLVDLAETKEGKEADELFREAFDKFQKVIDIKPDSHEAFNNWGNSLGNLAKTKEGKEADELFRKAFDKFQKSIDIKPDSHKAFNNWGTFLGYLARTKEGKEADELYKDAFDKLQKAIEYGTSYYNLSCVYALKGDKEKALKYLNTCFLKDQIDVDFVEKDEDWQDYLADKDFIKLLKKYKK